MNRYILIMLCLVLPALPGCHKKPTEFPPGVLQPAEMAAVLADIHVVQAAVSLHSASDTSFVPFSAYAPSVFRNHGITKAIYDSSISFYTLHPDLLDSIYKTVIDTLSKRQIEAESVGR